MENISCKIWHIFWYFGFRNWNKCFKIMESGNYVRAL